MEQLPPEARLARNRRGAPFRYRRRGDRLAAEDSSAINSAVELYINSSDPEVTHTVTPADVKAAATGRRLQTTLRLQEKFHEERGNLTKRALDLANPETPVESIYRGMRLALLERVMAVPVLCRIVQYHFKDASEGGGALSDDSYELLEAVRIILSLAPHQAHLALPREEAANYGADDPLMTPLRIATRLKRWRIARLILESQGFFGESAEITTYRFRVKMLADAIESNSVRAREFLESFLRETTVRRTINVPGGPTCALAWIAKVPSEANESGTVRELLPGNLLDLLSTIDVEHAGTILPWLAENGYLAVPMFRVEAEVSLVNTMLARAAPAPDLVRLMTSRYFGTALLGGTGEDLLRIMYALSSRADRGERRPPTTGAVGRKISDAISQKDASLWPHEDKQWKDFFSPPEDLRVTILDVWILVLGEHGVVPEEHRKELWRLLLRNAEPSLILQLHSEAAFEIDLSPFKVTENLQENKFIKSFASGEIDANLRMLELRRATAGVIIFILSRIFAWRTFSENSAAVFKSLDTSRFVTDSTPGAAGVAAQFFYQPSRAKRA